MRRLLSLVLAGLLVFGLALPFATPAAAEDLTPAQADTVRANCVSIKTSLNQLRVSDALLRVNQGQIYESMASKLMDNFNNRLSGNGFDNRATATVTANYRAALDTFRKDYISYEQKLTDAIRTDCTQQPNTFHSLIEEARTLRKTVHSDVKKLHRIIDDYRSSVGDFLLNYERLAS